MTGSLVAFAKGQYWLPPIKLVMRLSSHVSVCMHCLTPALSRLLPLAQLTSNAFENKCSGLSSFISRQPSTDAQAPSVGHLLLSYSQNRGCKQMPKTINFDLRLLHQSSAVVTAENSRARYPIHEPRQMEADRATAAFGLVLIGG